MEQHQRRMDPNARLDVLSHLPVLSTSRVEQQQSMPVGAVSMTINALRPEMTARENA